MEAAELNILLSNAGLSDKEAGAYLSLLKHGTQSISFIANKARLNRGTAYLALHSLLEKGLAIKSVKRKVQHFTALEPQQLVRYVEHRTEELQSAKKQIEDSLSRFEALVNPHTTKPLVEFFSGVDGARAALIDTLTSKEPVLRAFLSIADIAEFVGAEFFEEYTNRRIQAGFSLQVIRAREKDSVALERNVYASRYMASKKERREVRYVKGNMVFPISMYLYDEKLTLISSSQENFALIITSRELCHMQKMLFEMLWNTFAP